MSNFFILNFLF